MSFGLPRTACLALTALVIAGGTLGCGMKTKPVPPSQAIPVAITDLRAESEVKGIRLTFSRPDKYLGGSPMRDLNHFVIMRAEDDGPLKPLVEAPVPDRERLQQPKTLSYLDQDTQVNRSYRYAIVSVTDDGDESRPSNEVRVTRLAVPAGAKSAPAGNLNAKEPARAPSATPSR
jgi:hypothetical protein